MTGLGPVIHEMSLGISWMPTDQVRGLKAHGPSPATNGLLDALAGAVSHPYRRRVAAGAALPCAALPARQGGPGAPRRAVRHYRYRPAARSVGLAPCGERRRSRLGVGADRAYPGRTSGDRGVDDD